MVVLKRIASFTRMCSFEVERCCVRSSRQQLHQQVKRAFSTAGSLGLSTYPKSKGFCSLQATPTFGAGRRGKDKFRSGPLLFWGQGVSKSVIVT